MNSNVKDFAPKNAGNAGMGINLITRRKAQVKGMKNARRWLAGLAAAMVLGMSFAGCGGSSSSQTEGKTESSELIVFNYGDYIDYDLLDKFKAETGITVKYEEYVAPEDMYTKYKSGAIPYDLVITSEYMVEKMIREGEALAVDFSTLENGGNIGETYWDLCKAFDPENQYAIPYFWGTLGLVYNTTMVDEEDVKSWDVMWNEKYNNNIIMENSMRDCFVAPLKRMGESVNTTDKDVLQKALEQLIEQKPLVQAYYVDQSRDAMISGEAAIAQIYSGDATVAMESNEDLAYIVPEEGSNVWIDCAFLPATCRHQEEAMKFIDFLCREDVGMANFEYICYATPNEKVLEQLDDEYLEDPSIFPGDEILAKCEVFTYLGEEMDNYYNSLWKELKSK